MKKKFASYLLTGKAATLPFYAANSMAETLGEHIKAKPPCLIELPSDKVEVTSLALCKKYDEGDISARIAGCPGGKGPNVMTVVVVGLRAGDVVFIIASDDKDGYRDEWEPEFRLGKENTRFAASFLIPPARELFDIEELIKEPLKAFRIGGSEVKSAGEAVSLPIDLAKIPNKDGFHLQAVVIRDGEDGEAKVLFSEMDRIERIVEGEECPVLPPKDCDSTDPYGECFDPNAGGDPTCDPTDPYGGGASCSNDPGTPDPDTYGSNGSSTTTPPDDNGSSTTTPPDNSGLYGGGSY